MKTKFNSSLLSELKSKGYKTIQTNLINSPDPHLATVEIIPLRVETFGLDMVPIDSNEVLEYCDENNMMVNYLIDVNY